MLILCLNRILINRHNKIRPTDPSKQWKTLSTQPGIFKRFSSVIKKPQNFCPSPSARLPAERDATTLFPKKVLVTILQTIFPSVYEYVFISVIYTKSDDHYNKLRGNCTPSCSVVTLQQPGAAVKSQSPQVWVQHGYNKLTIQALNHVSSVLISYGTNTMTMIISIQEVLSQEQLTKYENMVKLNS